MGIPEQIMGIFESYDPYNFEPASCLQRCSALLDQACFIGGEFHPLDTDRAMGACNAYGLVSNLFLENGFSASATSILIEGWNKFNAFQRDTKVRIYRAGFGMYLAKAYQKLGDKGATFRWALLTQADDLLGEHPAGGGAGKQLLQSVLGMSEVALSELNQEAVANLEKIRKECNNDWSVPYAYAEDVITKFAYNRPEHTNLFSAVSSDLEFPINTIYFEALLNKVNSDAATTKEKGDRLEDLATYLFLTISGFLPRRNLLEETLAFESDIVVRNLANNVLADLLGRHFLAECKNWERSVGVQEIGYFLYRMRLTHARFGILFAKRGITGDQNQEQAAYSLIRKAFHEDGNICIVIDNDSLNSLCRSEVTFWPLILERIERIRFGKVR